MKEYPILDKFGREVLIGSYIVWAGYDRDTGSEMLRVGKVVAILRNRVYYSFRRDILIKVAMVRELEQDNKIHVTDLFFGERIIVVNFVSEKYRKLLDEYIYKPTRLVTRELKLRKKRDELDKRDDVVNEINQVHRLDGYKTRKYTKKKKVVQDPTEVLPPTEPEQPSNN